MSKTKQNSLNAILDTKSCYWIGLSDLAAEGKFVWQHSFSPLKNYTNWLPGEPNDYYGNEDCVMLKKGSHWGWIDEDCKATNCGNYGPLGPFGPEIHALCQS